MRFDSWITFVRQRQLAWGISAFVLWAAILAFLAFANVLLLSKVAELQESDPALQRQLWLIIFLNVGFGLGFALSAYGLWQRRNWGRTLFLWIVVIWSLVNVIALFAPGGWLPSNEVYSTGSRLLKGLRFTIGPAASLWYFNLPRVKYLFNTNGAENLTTEEVSEE